MKAKWRIAASVLAAVMTLSLAACGAQRTEGGSTVSTPSATIFSRTPLPSANPSTAKPDPEPAYKGAKLYTAPVEGKLCISIAPTIFRLYPRHYYVPNDAEQKTLQKLYLAYNGKSDPGRPIAINDLYPATDSELFQYAYKLVRDNCGIMLLDPKEIHDIVKAQMNYTIGGEKGVQVIDDLQLLRLIEGCLSNAAESGATSCPYHEALLTLTRKDGVTITLRLASDGCNMYFHDGQYFEYKGCGEDILSLFDQANWPALMEE